MRGALLLCPSGAHAGSHLVVAGVIRGLGKPAKLGPLFYRLDDLRARVQPACGDASLQERSDARQIDTQPTHKATQPANQSHKPGHGTQSCGHKRKSPMASHGTRHRSTRYTRAHGGGGGGGDIPVVRATSKRDRLKRQILARKGRGEQVLRRTATTWHTTTEGAHATLVSVGVARKRVVPTLRVCVCVCVCMRVYAPASQSHHECHRARTNVLGCTCAIENATNEVGAGHRTAQVQESHAQSR